MAQVSQEFSLFPLKIPWHKCHKNFLSPLKIPWHKFNKILKVFSQIAMAQVSQEFSSLLSKSRGTSVTRIFQSSLKIPVAQVSQDFFRSYPFIYPWHKCHKNFFNILSNSLKAQNPDYMTQDVINYQKTHHDLT